MAMRGPPIVFDENITRDEPTDRDPWLDRLGESSERHAERDPELVGTADLAIGGGELMRPARERRRGRAAGGVAKRSRRRQGELLSARRPRRRAVAALVVGVLSVGVVGVVAGVSKPSAPPALTVTSRATDAGEIVTALARTRSKVVAREAARKAARARARHRREPELRARAAARRRAQARRAARLAAAASRRAVPPPPPPARTHPAPAAPPAPFESVCQEFPPC